MKIFTIILSLLVFGRADSLLAQSVTTHDSTRMSIKSDKMPYINHFNTWDLTGHFGFTYPNTDIAASTLTAKTQRPKIAYGLDVSKYLSHTFALQMRFMRGQMRGIDYNKPNLTYYTEVDYDITLNAYFSFGNISFLKRTPNLAMFFSIGAGIIKYTPHVSLDGGKTYLPGIYSQFLDPLDTVNYANQDELIVPLSFGVKYRIAKHFSLVAEYSLRRTTHDKLDGWSKLLSEDDDYSYLNLGLTYHIGKKEHMAEWFNPLQSVYAELYDMKDKVALMSKDTDQDGVADMFDREPETPIGFKVYGDGTSIDSDGDGVPDFNDAEPFSPKLAVVDGSGREIDTDGDGVPDARDMEPNTPKGALVATGGQTIQNGPGVSKGGGSSIMASSGYLPSIFFALDSYEVQKKYDETLASIALVMKKNPDLKFTLTGNCDVRASVEYNTKLGLKRAEAVKKHLVKRYNIDASRISTTTLGKTDPITGTQPMNRRVDLAVDDK